MKAEQANIGDKSTCTYCKCEMICGMSQPFGNFPAKHQWQNPDGKAHYKPNMGGCNVPQIPPEQFTSKRLEEPTVRISVGRNDEQKVIDAIHMTEILWKPSLEKAKEVYKDMPLSSDKERSIMILAQVFFKAMVENFNK